MKSIFLALALVLSMGQFATAQTTTQLPQVTQTQDGDEVAGDQFALSLRSAIVKAQRDGTITRRERLRLTIALFSPAFRSHAKELAVTQMAFSGEEVPTLEDGRIDVASIDWNGLADFLERIVPILLQLIQLFGG